MCKTDLSVIVSSIAKRDRLPDSHPMVVAANAFDSASAGFYADPQTVHVAKFLGAWARARKEYCKYTGEPLI